MGAISISKNAGTGPSAITLQIPVSKGRLRSVSSQQIEGLSNPGALHVTCHLSQAPATLWNGYATLFVGAFTEYQKIGWTGDIPIEIDSIIYARFRTLGQATVQLSAYTSE